MNKTIEAVKNGQKVTAKEIFELINGFCITQISLTSETGKAIMSMQANQYEFRYDEHVFSQSCTTFDGVMYAVKAEDILDVTAKHNKKSDFLHATCKLKDGKKLSMTILHATDSQNKLKDYDEMDVEELRDFLEDTLHKKNGYYCVSAHITDMFGFDMTINNPVRTFVDTLDQSDWKLHISDDFSVLEVPVTDDLVNEFYVKDNEETGVKSIVVKPFGQPFMEISMLFFKKNEEDGE